MSNNLVIVAIPAADDSVWKVSSEKIPHLTLLFLGDAENNTKINEIFKFVWHAANVSEHGPFYMDVDRRDILGDDNADVIHFRKGWDGKWVTQFRNQLLQHPDIRTAYDSVEQFPEWRPHLTLGYPETPAHEDKIPDHGLNCVRFDRIAVWIGNYEGPEFRLEWPEREEDVAIAYSEAGEAAVADILHFGTKGMRWGVRKTNSQFQKSLELREKGGVGPNGTGPTTRKQFKQVRKGGELNQVVTSKVMTQTNQSSKKDLDNLRKRPEFQNINYVDSNGKAQFDVPKFKKYEKEVAKIWTGHLTKTVEKYEFDVDLTGPGWRLIPKTVKHSTQETLLLKPILDKDGYIVSVELGEDELVQADEFIDELLHFGTKGMRWGVRNKREMPTPVVPVAVSKVPQSPRRKTKIETEGGENHPASDDAIAVAVAKTKLQKSGPAALSNKELQAVANRVELEARVKRAVQPKGKKFVTRLLTNQGDQQANQFVNRQIKKSKFA